MLRGAAWAAVIAVCCGAAWSQEKAKTEEFSRRTPVVIAVEKTSPAVVNISTEKVATVRTGPGTVMKNAPDDQMLDEFWKRFGMETEVKTRSLGSGVLIHRLGYIVTNDHVVRRASKIQVSLLDGRTYEGQLISSDPERDLAVIKIEGKEGFPVIQMGRSNDLMIGETVIAMGNPFGFSHTVTVGVLSAKNRTVQVKDSGNFSGLLQTDASINPGSSGGPLLDINGKLIGINTAIRSQAEGIGFAIPVDEVRLAMVDLLNFRQIRKMWVGMSLTPVVRKSTGEPFGMKVTKVEEKSPAEEAGILTDDIITKMDGGPLTDVTEYEIGVLRHQAGEALELEVLRGEAFVNAKVTIGKLAMADPTQIVSRRLGLSVATLDEAAAKKAGLAKGEGILITGLAPDSPASKAGLIPGDVILQFANFRVTQPEDLGTLLTKLPINSRALAVVARGGYKNYVWMQVR